jgi:hypothetical protein
MHFSQGSLEPLPVAVDGFQAGNVSLVFRGTPKPGGHAKAILEGNRITIQWE